MTWDHLPDRLKHLGDAVSITALLGTLVSWLPSIAAVVTIIWTLIRIWETDTVRKLTRRV